MYSIGVRANCPITPRTSSDFTSESFKLSSVVQMKYIFINIIIFIVI